MKIGILGVMAKPISPSSTGGTEVFCALLSQGLAARGHDVTLFATKETELTGVRVVAVAEKTREAIRKDYLAKGNSELTEQERHGIDLSLVTRTLVTIARDDGGAYDIFHDNTSSYLVGAISDMVKTPIVTTLHMPPAGANQYVRIPPLVTVRDNYYVAISQWQKRENAVAKYFVYNGIDISQFDYSADAADHMVWISRISPNAPKGLPEAMKASETTGKKLVFSGLVSDQVFYDTAIAPHKGPNIQEVGAVTERSEKNRFYGTAKLALFPIQWEEPFGFVFVEAMSCGTPIIAYGRGSVPEIVVDGVTGFIVNPSDDDKRGDWIVKKTGHDGLCEAIERLYSLPPDQYKAMRQACRKRAEEHFTVEKMVEGYEKVYADILNR